MQITTKFDLNQKVFLIRKDFTREWADCPACGGSGIVIFLDKKERTCPECYGRKGNNINKSFEWLIVGILTIGSVRAKIENILPSDIYSNVGNYAEGNNEEEYSYMAYESGIGSGSIYYEKDLFATEEEAKAECDLRNESED